MNVVECGVPSTSALGRDMIESAYFSDSYSAPLTRPDLAITDIYAAIFAHPPLTMKLLLIVRNAIVRRFGLRAPAAAVIMRAELEGRYAVGKRVGLWSIFFIDKNEIVAGGNDRHQDFRVSVLRVHAANGASVVVSTICTVHNLFGKIYLFFIVPYHRHAVKTLLRNAVAAGRL
jgi:Protein of unknown function (DUF2867)